MAKEILLLLFVLGLMTSASGYAEEGREGAAARRGAAAEDQASPKGIGNYVAVQYDLW